MPKESDRKIQDFTHYRDLKLDRAGIDEDARTVPASLSSETEVPRWFGREVLVHEAGAVDLSRAADGLPLLFAHKTDQPIGLAENVRLDGDRLRADLRFSNNPKASEIWADVRDGFLKNISIGYRVHTWEENDQDDVVRVTEWELLEASVLPVPADASIGINRGQDFTEGKDMHKRTDNPATGNDAAGSGGDAVNTNVVDYSQARNAGRSEGIAEGIQAEARRRDEIEDLFSGPGYQSAEFQGLKETLIRNNDSVERAKEELLRMVGSGVQPVAGEYRQDRSAMGAGSVSAGVTGEEKVDRGIAVALAARLGTEKDPELVREAKENEYLAMPAYELARVWLNSRGIGCQGMTRNAIVRKVLAHSIRGADAHSTGSFTNILEDAANKSLLLGWNVASSDWRKIARVIPAPDFKQMNLSGLSEFSDLDDVPENGAFTHGTYSDRKEVLTLGTKGKLFGISRQALVNDDLSALQDRPQSMGRAAARVPRDLVFGVLTANAVLNQDGLALFVAGHSNYVAAGSGAAPSVATLDAGFTAMGTQTDPSGEAILNIEPAYLIVPKALETTARVLATAANDPTASASIANGQPNPFQNRVEVVADGVLDADSTTKWYLSANPNQTDTVVIAFLDGAEEPYLDSKEGWTVDGIEYKVRLDAAATAADFRGLYLNDGA